MKPDLLSAVLAEDEAFRAETLRQTVALARRRRRVRLARQTLCPASFLALVAFLFSPPKPVLKLSENEQPGFVVRTAPLARQQRVQTTAKLFTPVASASTPFALIASKPSQFLLVETRTPASGLELISDEQLFTSFRIDRAALIAHGTPEARLVFY